MRTVILALLLISSNLLGGEKIQSFSAEEVSKNQFALKEYPVFVLEAICPTFKQVSSEEYRISWGYGVYAITDSEKAKMLLKSPAVFVKIISLDGDETKVEAIGNTLVVRGLDKVIGWKQYR